MDQERSDEGGEGLPGFSGAGPAVSPHPVMYSQVTTPATQASTSSQGPGSVSPPSGEAQASTSSQGPRASEGENGMEVDEQPEEGTASRAMTAPIQPTKKMIEDHEASHLPFRNWCAACVRGRAKSMPHRTSHEKDEAISTFSIDYGFFGSPGETPIQSVAGKDLPVLVAYDRKYRAIFAHPVPHKGLKRDGLVDDCPVKGAQE